MRDRNYREYVLDINDALSKIGQFTQECLGTRYRLIMSLVDV
jgi:hypothetical protein